MSDTHMKDRLFFPLYLLLLLFALVWTHFEYVLSNVGTHLGLLRSIIVGALAYVLIRAFVVVRLHAPAALSWLWLTIDLALITVMVRLSGGVRSDASLGYVIPVLTGAVELRPRRVVLAGVAAGALYLAACWSPALGASGWDRLATRLFFLAILTTLAMWYAIAEARRVAELTHLREQLVLADYRERLSQELHDGVQHYLVVAVSRLELAGKVVARENPEQALQLAVGVIHTIRQAADELRYLVRRLRSPRLDRQSFVEALREHLALYGDRAPFALTVLIEAEQVTVPVEVEQAAFRIVQEALTNAQKYAAPTEVTVSLSLTPQRLQVVVRDDGAGFEVGAVHEDVRGGEGLGLAGMRHRAESVGGELELQSRPGAGCTVTFRIGLTALPDSAPKAGESAAASEPESP